MKLPEKRARIRKGQIWKKRDSGMVVRLVASHGSDKFSYDVLGEGKKSKGHQIYANDLYRFWDRL